MEKCLKCGRELTDNDLIYWKCTKCGKVFTASLLKLKNLQRQKKLHPGQALLKCPGCGYGIDDGKERMIYKCVGCGSTTGGNLENFVEDTTINTYEIIPSESNTQVTTSNKIVAIHKKHISVVFFLVTIFLFIIAFTRINNDTYRFYKQHYKECMEGYADCKATGNDYAGWFKNSYESIASTYEHMAKDDNKNIWKYRIQSIVLCLCGLICCIVGYKIKRKYDIKGYYENKQKQLISIDFNIIKSKFVTRRIIPVAVVCIMGCCIYYFSTRCAYNGCTEKRTSSSKYCAYHSLSYSYGLSSFSYMPKTGYVGAHERAESYLNSSAFSYTGLIEQLEYEGFSESEAKYGVNSCDADWELQAVKKAKSYLNSSAFSYSGLKKQLRYEGFTKDEAKYGVDNCNGDWNEQAAKKVDSYLHSLSNMSRSRLIEQLQFEGFTYQQAVYGVEQSGL